MTALMGSRGTSQAGQPTWWASLAVRSAALPLPSEHRWRYRQEFLAELYGMTPAEQRHHGHALALPAPTPPLAAAAQSRRRLVPRMHGLRTTTLRHRRTWRRRRSRHTMTTTRLPWASLRHGYRVAGRARAVRTRIARGDERRDRDPDGDRRQREQHCRPEQRLRETRPVAHQRPDGHRRHNQHWQSNTSPTSPISTSGRQPLVRGGG
jgi:hypothetical protein